MPETRPYVVTNRDGIRFNIMGLSGSRLFGADIRKSRLDDAAGDIHDGHPPEEVLGSKGTYIDVAAVRRVEIPAGGSNLEVHHAARREIEETTLELGDPHERVELLSRLEAAMGPGCRSASRELSFGEACWRPLLFSIAAPVLTFCFYMAANQMAAGHQPELGGRRGAQKEAAAGIISVIGPAGVVIVGVIVSLACVGWLVYRSRNRPRVEVLLRPQRVNPAGS